MSDHTWTQEQLAAYVAGGLDAAEAERLLAHTCICDTCAAALASAVELDQRLDALFADVHPDTRLEDRLMLTLRTAPSSRSFAVTGWPRRAMTAVAAVLLLGAFGGVVGSLVNEGGLPMPGGMRSASLGRDAAPMSPPADRAPAGKLEGGLDAEAIARTQDISKAYDVYTDGRNVDAAVTSDPIGVPDKPGSDANAYAVPGLDPGKSGRSAAPRNERSNSLEHSTGATTYFVPGQLAPGAGGGAVGFGGGNTGGIGGFGGGGFAGGGFGGYPPGMSGPPSAGYGKGRPAAGPIAPGGGGSSLGPVPGGGMPPVTPASPVATAQPPKNTDPKLPPPMAPVNPEPVRRVVIRSGDMEFEVESFDAAIATVTKLVTSLQGAFVATVNSEKLPNGKVKGSITLRTPPEHLDGLVLDLRRELGKGGELKGVKISSQDITKQYTDMESRLKAARAMELRLLAIIKDGKGEIKQLLEAEKELGVWRTKIEEVEGELRYFSNLAALSTLTITLNEKELRTAVEVTEGERVQAGVEVEDVDKAYQELLAAITAAKGRIISSEVKQLAAGQFNAGLQFEVAPEQSGPLRDRLRMLGRVARLEIDRVQNTAGTPVPKDAKQKRGETEFVVQLYNLANVAPRETAVVQIAVTDVPAAYQAIREVLGKTTGRVLNATLNEQDRTNVTGQLDFEVRRTDEPTVRTAIDAAGEVVSRQVARAPESDAVTDSKVLYRATLLAAHKLKPRETTTMTVEVPDVEQATTVFGAQVAEAKGRQLDARSDRDRTGKVTAHLLYEVPLAAAAGVVERFKSAGTVRVHNSARDPQAPEGKYATARINVTLTGTEPIVAGNDGLWPPVKKGLTYSASVLLTSVTWVVFGLCVVLPWAVVGYGGYRVVRWAVRPAVVAVMPPTPPAA